MKALFFVVPGELVGSGLLGMAVCGAAIRRVRGTTLVAPVAWSGFSWMTLMAGELIASQATDSTAQLVRYLAAVSTFCAPMALLGAKRPQDRGWQFIVASLWLVLCVPAIQLTILTPSGTLELHLAWRVLLGTLIFVGVTNHLPTRFGWAALAYGIGQWRLLGVNLLREVTQYHAPPWWAFGCLLIAAIGPMLQAILMPHHHLGWNRIWRDFRDAFGCVWALRVAERMNQAARQANQRLEFTWQGVRRMRGAERADESAEAAISGDSLPTTESRFAGLSTDNHVPLDLGELEVTMRQLLRRFVSAEWIDARLPSAPSARSDRSL